VISLFIQCLVNKLINKEAKVTWTLYVSLSTHPCLYSQTKRNNLHRGINFNYHLRHYEPLVTFRCKSRRFLRRNNVLTKFSSSEQRTKVYGYYTNLQCKFEASERNKTQGFESLVFTCKIYKYILKNLQTYKQLTKRFIKIQVNCIYSDWLCGINQCTITHTLCGLQWEQAIFGLTHTATIWL